MSGEIKLLKIPYETVKANFIPGKGLDVGMGVNEQVDIDISGGVVGIILDGRGRNPFVLPKDSNTRIKSLLDWSCEVEEYPDEESDNV